jgi:hypothetical protein
MNMSEIMRPEKGTHHFAEPSRKVPANRAIVDTGLKFGRTPNILAVTAKVIREKGMIRELRLSLVKYDCTSTSTSISDFSGLTFYDSRRRPALNSTAF